MEPGDTSPTDLAKLKHRCGVAVTNVGHDRTQLTNLPKQAKAIIGTDKQDVVPDRGYVKGEEILECDQAGITTYRPKPKTSNNIAKGLVR
jgi:transposase